MNNYICYKNEKNIKNLEKFENLTLDNPSTDPKQIIKGIPDLYLFIGSSLIIFLLFFRGGGSKSNISRRRYYEE